jgi:quercetin dioxygenase-like cupin family protein
MQNNSLPQTKMGTPAAPRWLLIHPRELKHQANAVVHRSMFRTPHGSITLFAIDDGECISEHRSHNDELVYVMDGEIELVLAGTPYRMKKGEICHITPYTLHRVQGIQNGKIMLVILRNPRPGTMN